MLAVKLLQESDKKIRSVSQALDVLLRADEPVETRRGPYSFSRLNTCNQQFKFKYIDELDGQEITRFGRHEGSAVHDACERDIRMRMRLDQKDWVSPADIVDKLIHQKPKYEPYLEQLTDAVERFRHHFPTYPQDYVGSEEMLGATLGMERAGYNAAEAWLRGRVDYLEIDDANIARVTDFKNYPTIHGHNDFNNVDEGVGKQLMGYGALVMANYPSVQGLYYEVYYTQFGALRESSRKNKKKQRQRKYYDRQYIEEEWWPRLQRQMLAKERLPKEHFGPQPSRTSCQYCPFMAPSRESDLPQCSWAQKQADREIMARTEQEAIDLLDELIVLEEKRNRLKDALGAYARLRGEITNEAGAWYGYRPEEKTVWDPEVVLEAARRECGSQDPVDLIEFLAKHLELNKRSVDQFADSLTGDTRAFLKDKGQHVEQRTRLNSSL